jgi:DNA adenine methylase
VGVLAVSEELSPPFWYFGGKKRAASFVWAALGDVANYVDPFCGSLAVLLLRPHAPRIETVNDKSHFLANFWRAVRAKPDEVAERADYPALEVDLHARHEWLVARATPEWRARLEADPEWYDAEAAGVWVWGINLWIGGGWCTNPEWRGRGHVGASPRGVHGTQVRAKTWRQLPDLSGSRGAAGRGVHASGKREQPLVEWMEALSARLRHVRVSCGDFARILTPSTTAAIGTTGVLLDPPYPKYEQVYAEGEAGVAERAREWALANGDNPALRIALCGYEGDFDMPPTWRCQAWKAAGGYAAAAGNTENSHRERIWFSPHSLKPERSGQAELFSEVGT